MIRRLLHHPLVWSPVLAAAAQLVLASRGRCRDGWRRLPSAALKPVAALEWLPRPEASESPIAA